MALFPGTELRLPDPPFPLEGFPLCRGRGNTCKQEVLDRETKCPACGGPPIPPDCMKRTYLRQLRTAVATVLGCLRCEDKDVYGQRCAVCTFNSGAAFAIGGFMERHGWDVFSNPLMALIFKGSGTGAGAGAGEHG